MKKGVLLVDDNHRSLTALGNLLGQSGYAVSLVTEPSATVSKFEQDAPEIVFLSLAVPKAIDLCERLRDHPDGAIVPIIFVGDEHSSIRSPADALASGGDFFFEHPLNALAVVQKVRTYIGEGGDVAPLVPAVPARPDEPDALAGAAEELLGELGEQPQLRIVHDADKLRATNLEAETQRALDEIREKTTHQMQEVVQAAQKNAEEQARRIIESARQKAEEEARTITAEAKRKAEEETRRKDFEKRRQHAQDLARRRVEEETKRMLEQAQRQAHPVDGPMDGESTAEAPREQAAIERAAPSGALSALDPIEGTFGEGDDIAHVLVRIYQQRVTGRVDVIAQGRQKTVFFERGGAVHAYSSQVFDRMEEFLLREGKITRPQYQIVRAKGLQGARRVAAFLVSEGYLKSTELFDIVRGHLKEVVHSVFEWPQGQYRYLPEAVEEEHRVVLEDSPRALISDGIRRKYSLERLVAFVGGPSSLLRMKGATPIDYHELRFGVADRQVIKLLDGTRNIEDIVFNSGLGPYRVYQLLGVLLALGFVEVAVRGIELSPTARAENDGIDRERILDKYRQARELDYYEVLGVSRTATGYEIEQAYERAVREFDGNRFSDNIQAELGDELAEIDKVFFDARHVLTHPTLREAYTRNLT